MKFEIMVKSHRPQSSVMLYKIPNELIITILHFDVDYFLCQLIVTVLKNWTLNSGLPLESRNQESREKVENSAKSTKNQKSRLFLIFF